MKRLELINDSKCYYFEHALYDAIQEARASMVKFIPIPIGIRQKGVSGTSGMPLHSSTLKNDIKNFIKCLLLLTKMDKFLK